MGRLKRTGSTGFETTDGVAGWNNPVCIVDEFEELFGTNTFARGFNPTSVTGCVGVGVRPSTGGERVCGRP